MVTKQEPLFLSDYKHLRPRLLKTQQWDFVARLGEHAFESSAAAGAFVALLGLSRRPPEAGHSFLGLSAAEDKTPDAKALALRQRELLVTSQAAQLKNPDAAIVLGESMGDVFLSQYANAWQGIATSDYPRFSLHFWELPRLLAGWTFQQSVPNPTSPFSGRESILFWEDGTGAITEVCQKGATFRGKSAWGRSGVVVGQMRSLPVAIYTGEIFSNTVAVLVPYTPDDLPAIWSFARSTEFGRLLRKVNPKVNVDNGYISKIPFDIEEWREVGKRDFPAGIPVASSAQPTQWLFSGDPNGSSDPLQVAVGRLVGYRWPRQAGSSFKDCPPLVPDAIDKHADADGILCLSSLGGAEPAAQRLRQVLEEAYGANWSSSKLTELLKGAGSLDEWLRDKFFDQHCALFDNHPFVWHVWDGRQDGFHALVNYHKLAGPNGEGKLTLEKLIYSSIGDWIGRQRAEVVGGADGADARLSAAQHLQGQLEKILLGESPYDIFVRWKPIHEQSLGWEPDVNDGVRLNIRPWLAATLAPHTKPKKGACILRVTPKIVYGKDRGKEPGRDKRDFPWFAESTDRDNDIHLSLDEKRAARARRKK